MDRLDTLCLYLNRMIEGMREELLERFPRKTFPVIMEGRRWEMTFRPVGAMAMNLWKEGVLVYWRDLLINSNNQAPSSLLDDILLGIEEYRQNMIDQDVQLLDDLADAIYSFYWCDPEEYLGPFPSPMVEDPHEEGEESSIIPPTYYLQYLEQPFLEATRQFYAKQSALALANRKDLTQYVVYAERVLRRETELIGRLFHLPDTLGHTMTVVEEQVIRQHASTLHADFSSILHNHDDHNLRIVYGLLGRIPEGLEPLVGAYEAFVEGEAQMRLEELKIYFDETGQPTDRRGHGLDQPSKQYQSAMLVNILAPLVREIGKQVAECLGDDVRFKIAGETAFHRILKRLIPRSTVGNGQLLAEFFDLLFRDQLIAPSSTVGTNSSFESLREDGLRLVSLLLDREEFTLAYVDALAARLLFRTSRHGTAELATIEALKETLGGEECVRLARMINDISISHRLQRHFEEYLHEKNISMPCKKSNVVM